MTAFECLGMAIVVAFVLLTVALVFMQVRQTIFS
jgi:hypothetical protein